MSSRRRHPVEGAASGLTTAPGTRRWGCRPRPSARTRQDSCTAKRALRPNRLGRHSEQCRHAQLSGVLPTKVPRPAGPATGVALCNTIGRIDGPRSRPIPGSVKYIFPRQLLSCPSEVMPALERNRQVDHRDVEILPCTNPTRCGPGGKAVASELGPAWRRCYDERFCRMLGKSISCGSETALPQFGHGGVPDPDGQERSTTPCRSPATTMYESERRIGRARRKGIAA